MARGNITTQETVHGDKVGSHESAIMLVETLTQPPPGYSTDAFCAGSFVKWPKEHIAYEGWSA